MWRVRWYLVIVGIKSLLLGYFGGFHGYIYAAIMSRERRVSTSEAQVCEFLRAGASIDRFEDQDFVHILDPLERCLLWDPDFVY